MTGTGGTGESSSTAASADCVTKIHQTNCCGSTVAIGVSTSASSAFDTAEKACEAMYPGWVRRF